MAFYEIQSHAGAGGSAGNTLIQICLQGALNVLLECSRSTLAEADAYRL